MRYDLDGINPNFDEDNVMTKEIKVLPCMATSFDGAHCGLTDWYPKIEEGIIAALKKGPSHVWTTGWYASKKEIASAKITSTDGHLLIEASVSDDFDTEGIGSVTIKHTTDIEAIRKNIYLAWDQAEENRKDNQEYRGFSIIHKGTWVETYIQDISGWDLDTPPGDNYHQWGFQDEAEIPQAIKNKLEHWAISNTYGENKGKQFTYKGYTIKPWEDK